MKQFTVKEVPLRGRIFNFYPACEKLNVSREVAEEVLWAMHIAARVARKKVNFNEMQVKILPNTFSKEHFLDATVISKCIDVGLIVEKSENQYEITPKMEEILKETIKIKEN